MSAPTVWYAIPTKRPPGEDTIELWRERGYRIALFVDEGDPPKKADTIVVGKYEGYAKAVNYLVRTILAEDPMAAFIVTGGDDIEPDMNHSALEAAILVNLAIAHTPRQAILSPPELPRWSGTTSVDDYQQACFRMIHRYVGMVQARKNELEQRPLLYNPLFSVCQPTGDRWTEDDSGSAAIDRVAGSPWMGRLFCQRMYGGTGPLFHGYFHMFVDEELQNVAQRLGVFAQTRRLTQKHRHWQRVDPDATFVSGVNPVAPAPPHLAFANSRKHWDDAKLMFEQRFDANFPDHEPIDWSQPA